MNEIAKIGSGTALALPAVSTELNRALGLAERDQDALHRFGLPARVVTEAAVALEAMQPLPAGPATVMEWLKPVASAVRNPPGREDAEKRATAVAVACADLPAGAFNRAALRRGMQKWEFWPSAADVRAVLVEEVSDWVARKRALVAVARARVSSDGNGAETRPAPTTDERRAVSALVAALRAETAAREVAAEAVRHPARPSAALRPEHLAAARAALGGRYA